MILFIEPISKNTGMYVSAYPLPIMEIGSYIKRKRPELEIRVLSFAVDYGLPLTPTGKNKVHREFLNDLARMKPKAIGISCTAIAQAEESISLCEMIKDYDKSIFIFMGGYFPTIYYEEILFKTSAIDIIVTGEGEDPALMIVDCLEKRQDPRKEGIPNLVWKKNGQIRKTEKGSRFDLNNKAPLNLNLLNYPKAYDILPYAFSRGCPYRCNFCMEEYIRPVRKEVPFKIVKEDISSLSKSSKTRSILVSDTLFKSFELFPFLRSLNMKVNFETRCDGLKPSIISQIADVCGILVFGFESASFDTLKRMNKVRDIGHYEYYISNTIALFKEAVKREIPVMMFMIAGYPGDTEKDLEDSLNFARKLSEISGPGGHLFKIGECHVYPKTNIYDLATSMPDVIFDDDGVFGQNIVRRPSKELNFNTVLQYTEEIFHLSNVTTKLLTTILNMMPFFRLPVQALRDFSIPDICFKDNDREVFNAQGESLYEFRRLAPILRKKYRKDMSAQRSSRILPI